MLITKTGKNTSNNLTKTGKSRGSCPLFRLLSTSLLIAGWAGLITTSAAAGEYSKATKMGSVDFSYACPAGSKWDPRNGGECRSCPKNSKMVLFECRTATLPVLKTAVFHSKKKKLFSECPAGTFQAGVTRSCYTCPSGFRHNGTLPVEVPGVCFKPASINKHPAKVVTTVSAGTVFNPRLVGKELQKLGCGDHGERAFLDPVDGGSCWSCPATHPQRMLYSVKGQYACATAKCGGSGERPCLVWERGLSGCNSGLMIDPGRDLCVKPSDLACDIPLRVSGDVGKLVRKANATGTAISQAALSKIPLMAEIIKFIQTESSRADKLAADVINKLPLDRALATIDQALPNPEAVAQLNSVLAALSKHQHKLQSIYEGDLPCSSRADKAKLIFRNALSDAGIYKGKSQSDSTNSQSTQTVTGTNMVVFGSESSDQTEISGYYEFVHDRSSGNHFKMQGDDLMVSASRDGNTALWHKYKRTGRTAFQAASGPAHVYEIRGDGSLIWRSGRSEKIVKLVLPEDSNELTGGGPPSGSIEGQYAFETDISRINLYEMIGENLKVFTVRDGEASSGHMYNRISRSKFKAASGVPHTYEILSNGKLQWSNGRNGETITLVRYDGEPATTSSKNLLAGKTVSLSFISTVNIRAYGATVPTQFGLQFAYRIGNGFHDDAFTISFTAGTDLFFYPLVSDATKLGSIDANISFTWPGKDCNPDWLGAGLVMLEYVGFGFGCSGLQNISMKYPYGRDLVKLPTINITDTKNVLTKSYSNARSKTQEPEFKVSMSFGPNVIVPLVSSGPVKPDSAFAY